MKTTTHPRTVHPAPEKIVVILALGVAAWFVLGAGLYLFGLGALTVGGFVGGGF